MFIRSFSSTFLLLVICYSQTFASLPGASVEREIKILSQSFNSITIQVSASNYRKKELDISGTHYSKIFLKNFGLIGTEGEPALPKHVFSLITDNNPNISINILESDFTIIKDVLLYPVQKALATSLEPQDNSFIRNEQRYSINEFYPAKPVIENKEVTYYGIPVSRVAITPIQHNPVTRELKVFNKLVFKIDFQSCPNQKINTLNSYKTKLLNNIVVNPLPLNNIRRSEIDTVTDVLILTREQFVPAAETLAVWQRQKGYDVNIHILESENYRTVKATVDSICQTLVPKPSYLLIIGDDADINTFNYEELAKTWPYSKKTIKTDIVYSCLDGTDDTYPDMASGRISPSSATEAMTMVKKIINYEKNPTTKSNFYKNTLAAAYFQDGEDSSPNYADSYEDRSFVECIERVKNYLDDKHSYTSTRVYNAKSDVNPLYWNKTNYSDGSPLPEYLKKPTFAWDGNSDDIISSINDGCFLVYHYDHGTGDGWHKPSFEKEHIPQLTNGDMLPLIYSIDCLVGAFWGSRTCFAEEITRYKNGGAIGIIAASQVTYSGPNDVLLLGMVDATWPGDDMIIYNGAVTSHEPVYRMGDILNQGLIRMEEQWDDEKLVRWHRLFYHLFGDPTVRLWTAEPREISLNTPVNGINTNDSDFKLMNIASGSELIEGMATLYNVNSDEIIGKSEALLGDVMIPLNQSVGENGDTVVLTVTAHNCRPFIKKIIMSGPVGNNFDASLSNQKPYDMKLRNNLINFNVNRPGYYSITIYEVNGKVLHSVNRKFETGEYRIPLANKEISSGARIVAVRYNGHLFIKRMVKF